MKVDNKDISLKFRSPSTRLGDYEERSYSLFASVNVELDVTFSSSDVLYSDISITHLGRDTWHSVHYLVVALRYLINVSWQAHHGPCSFLFRMHVILVGKI